MLIVSVFFAGFAGATTVLKTDIKQMTLSSEAILEGAVTDVESRYEKGQTTIATYVEIKPAFFLKGKNERVTLRIPGGQVGGKGLKVFGVPEFQKDQKVFLFLKKNPAEKNIYSVNGFNQGRYMLFESKGVTHAVADNGMGLKIFESCPENAVKCLEEKGLGVRTYSEMIEKIKTWLTTPEMSD